MHFKANPMQAGYFIPKERSSRVFDASIPPALEVDSGAIVTFETSDAAYEKLWKTRKVMHGGYNVVTGPLRVRGAMPGDALRIGILDVEITRAWAAWFPDYGLVKTKKLRMKQVRIARGRIAISRSLTVPLRPMIGCIGTAPTKGAGSAYEPAYSWGGNMDLPQICPGAVLHLPVYAPGGPLSVGDLHAAMGEAEAASVGFEAAGRAVLKVEVAKGMKLSCPRIRLGETTYLVGIGENMDAARRTAAREAWKFLRKDLRLAEFDAFAYFASRVDLRFGGPAADIVLAAVPDP